MKAILRSLLPVLPILLSTGCFSMLAEGLGDGASPGTVALDIVTAPVQIVWAAGAGLCELGEYLDEKERERTRRREMRKAERRIREDPQLLVSHSDSLFRGTTLGGYDAVPAVLVDPDFVFTEEQLLAIDSTWAAKAPQHWSFPPCRGLWTRPEWTSDSLAAASDRIMAAPRNRIPEAIDYASNTNVPPDCLQALIAHDWREKENIDTAVVSNILAAAHANLESRISHAQSAENSGREECVASSESP